MDIDEIRSSLIELHGLKNLDDEYNFFYDETNNIRKFKLNGSTGFNIPIEDITKNFVLGGIVYKNSSIDFENLKSSLSLSKNIAEIKFKHIASGSFFDCLKSNNLNIFLTWLQQQPSNIHFSTLDIPYWSIVDIIDSGINNLSSPIIQNIAFMRLNELKALFYELIKISLSEFVCMLNSFGYPVVSIKDSENFSNFCIKVINQGLNKIDSRFLDIDMDLINLLLRIFEDSKGKELSFLEKREDLEHILLENFSDFYRHRTWLFVYSKHTFDEEKQVSRKLDSMVQYYKGEKIINYIFSNSMSEEMIQVSDVIVGILGKYFTFINQINSLDIEAQVETLDPRQKDNLSKLLKLSKDAELYNKAFIHYTSSIVNIRKDLLVSEISLNK